MAKAASKRESLPPTRYGVVVSRFNEFISSKLLSGALETLREHGVAERDVEVVHVPGAFEIPLAALKLADSFRFDAIICLGCVIRGQTPHFQFVAGEAARGIMEVSLDSGLPVAFGVLTTDTMEQALDRAGAKGSNKGVEAALTAIEMVKVCRNVTERS
jgi:6,7-dimethyl-8-ribityllumazine synthase